MPSRSDPAEWAWPLSTTAGPPGGQGEAAGSRSPGRSFYLGGRGGGGIIEIITCSLNL